MVAIVLSRPRKFALASWAIRNVTWSDVSHASLHFLSDGGVLGEQVWVYEAVAHGVRLCPIDRWLEHNDPRYKIGVKDDDLGMKALRIGMHEIGASYDYAGIGKFAAYLICRQLHVGMANWITRSTPDTLFCSEAVLRVVQIMAALSDDPEEFDDIPKWNPDLTAPEDLKRLHLYSPFVLCTP